MFHSCTKLKSLVLPKSVTAVERAAFFECKNLTDIVVPDSVTNIGAYAFEKCKLLSDVTMSANIENIGERAFFGCDNLRNIQSHSENGYTHIWNALGTKQKNNALLTLAQKKCDSMFVQDKIKKNKKKLVDIALENDNAELVENIYSLCEKIDIKEIDECIDKAVGLPQIMAFLLEYKNKHHKGEIK